jgi:predicted small metal-binding protein
MSLIIEEKLNDGCKCDWVVKTQNGNELMKLIKEHAKKCHY